ncbi:MAG TPA: PAS domain S-box protein, partial [Spirochaetota bacterium]|nr:PAS domain S-box protein [Spirochaetota bacterium]
MATKAGHQHNDFYRQIISASREAVITADLDNRITFVNQAAVHLYDYNEKELPGQKVTRLLTAKSAKRYRRQIKSRVLKGEIWSGELVNRAKKGKTFTAHIKCIPLRLKTKQISAVSILCSKPGRPSYPDKKKAARPEQTAAKTKTAYQKLYNILQTMAEGMVIVDAKGKITDTNPKGEKILELGKDKLTGDYYFNKKWRQIDKQGHLIPAASLPLSIALTQKKHVYHYEHGISIPAGLTKWLSVNVSPITDDRNKLHGAIATFRDISQRKQIEDKLEFQAMLLENINDYITATDLKGNITYVNNQEKKLAGGKADELIGQNVSVFGEDPDLGATQKEIVKATRKNGSWRGEVVNITSDGKKIIFDSRTSLFHDEQGRPAGMVGIST